MPRRSRRQRKKHDDKVRQGYVDGKYISISPEWKCLQTRITKTMWGYISRYRALIKAPNNTKIPAYEHKAYTLYDVGDKNAIYFVVTCMCDCPIRTMKGMDKYFVKDIKDYVMLVRPLPNEIIYDEQALSWANLYMRGNSVEESVRIYDEFYNAISNFRHIDLPLSTKIIKSRKSCRNGICQDYLYTTLDGIVVNRGRLCFKTWDESKYKESADYFDETLPMLRQVLPEDVHGNFWDLETRDELNSSNGQTYDRMEHENEICDEFVNYIAPDAKELKLDPKIFRYKGISADINLYDKYMRTINSEMYNKMYDKLSADTQKKILSVLGRTITERGILRLIFEYSKVIKITEDYVRKLRVKNWLDKYAEWQSRNYKY